MLTFPCQNDLRLSAGNGVYFYEKGCCFKLNWQKGKLRGSVVGKALHKDDVEACKKTHTKFHEKAEEIA